MKLEFESIDELVAFYKKYVEPSLKDTKNIQHEKQKIMPQNDLILKTLDNNKMNMTELARILK